MHPTTTFKIPCYTTWFYLAVQLKGNARNAQAMKLMLKLYLA